jgi:hypothetical protein
MPELSGRVARADGGNERPRQPVHVHAKNKVIEPPTSLPKVGRIQCRKELGGRLNYYYREAAWITIFQGQPCFW